MSLCQRTHIRTDLFLIKYINVNGPIRTANCKSLGDTMHSRKPASSCDKTVVRARNLLQQFSGFQIPKRNQSIVTYRKPSMWCSLTI